MPVLPRAKQIAEEEAATALFFQMVKSDEDRKREKEEEASLKAVEDILSNQARSSVATATRSRTRRPETLQEMQTRMLAQIAEAKRIDAQNAELQAINAEAALTDTTLLNDDNPLYCVICFSLAEQESHMRGWTCEIRRHFICRDCWYNVEFCPSCGQSAKRRL